MHVALANDPVLGRSRHPPQPLAEDSRFTNHELRSLRRGAEVGLGIRNVSLTDPLARRQMIFSGKAFRGTRATSTLLITRAVIENGCALAVDLELARMARWSSSTVATPSGTIAESVR